MKANKTTECKKRPISISILYRRYQRASRKNMESRKEMDEAYDALGNFLTYEIMYTEKKAIEAYKKSIERP